MRALHPELNALIDRGLLARAQAGEAPAFADELRAAVARGELTLAQADALGQLLGVQHAANTNATPPNNRNCCFVCRARRARRSLP